ncbi:M24 family metallopeptidase [Ketogulonicigenium vulgare]|uniref:M24 family metallopeptidase n=1 Tax=Ketogulonicigenium vulgare TaxID=92945 RepID=UPI002359582C|nr:Xaa-Pro peptidase family protein [Ketogulonicigenium vulgare]
MSYIDRARASWFMSEAGLDALLLFEPESFRYATGLDGGVATAFRRAGACAALVPCDPGASIAAILSDHQLHFGPSAQGAIELITHPTWIDYVDISDGDHPAPLDSLARAYKAQGLGGARPETFDRDLVNALIGDLLTTRGLENARVGIDMAFIPANDLARLKAALPRVTWVDGSALLDRIRSVKTAHEIACLRNANLASEAGLLHMADHAQIGMARSELDRLWRDGAARAASAHGFKISGDRAGIAVGPNLIIRDPVLENGHLIKADMGVAVENYLSDGTRSYVMGAPSPMVRTIFAAIEDVFEAGITAIRPGATFGDVHRTVLDAVKKAGLPESYCRGHFGHSIGAACMEEWPFFSARNPEEILPGMVLAFEVPMYLHGTGAMMIEDQLLVTETGIEVMNKLPRGLTVLG